MEDRITKLPCPRPTAQAGTPFMSHSHAGFLTQGLYKEIFSSVPAQPISIHRACDEGGGDQGEMDLRVWPECCSVHIGDLPYSPRRKISCMKFS